MVTPTASAARVHLLSPDRIIDHVPPHARAGYEQLRDGFARQATTAHVLVEKLDETDIVIAPIQGGAYGPCFERLRGSREYRQHVQKLIMYCPDDNQFPAIRGLYAAATRKWVECGWILPAHYISSHIHKFHFRPDELDSKDILFSFVGSSRTHPVREGVMALRNPRGVLIDSNPKTDTVRWWDKTNREELFATFRDVTRRSQFAICPRGISPSSIRLFEAMEAGAVPVLVSDDIQLPHGPDWNQFTVRIPEREVGSIPSVVERLEDRAVEMGRLARRVWESYFSESATIGSVVQWAQRLLPADPSRPASVRIAEYLNPRRIRAKIRHALR